jgi:hypothetical protein
MTPENLSEREQLSTAYTRGAWYLEPDPKIKMNEDLVTL